VRLCPRGVAVRAVDREQPGPGKPLVMTMHRAKGMEFTKVVLADVGHRSDADAARLARMDQSGRQDAELRARSLVYVAATRARDELSIIRRRWLPRTTGAPGTSTPPRSRRNSISVSNHWLSCST
jgi:superfamily I DNA/RNA helicase